jgi:hypothetical protein
MTYPGYGASTWMPFQIKTYRAGGILLELSKLRDLTSPAAFREAVIEAARTCLFAL